MYFYPQTVDLVPNGSKMEVTNENKIYYLNCLAQYKLVSCVKEEVEHFLKGLNSIISDNLLSIFDENELEVSIILEIFIIIISIIKVFFLNSII